MKKILCIILSALFLLSSLTAFAEDATSADLERVLKIVKGKLALDSAYDAFDYQVYDDVDGRSWSFTWRNDDADKSVTAVSNDAGAIMSYYSYNPYVDFVPPMLTRAEAELKARAYLKKLAPEVFGKLDEKTKFTNQGFYNKTYAFTYTRVENTYPVIMHTADIYIRYDTGELDRYNLSWDFDMKFDVPDSIVSLDDAMKKWNDALELDLRYFIKYDDEKRLAYLAYEPTEQLYPIDAQSGEFIKESVEWEKKQDFDSAAVSYAAGAESGATPEVANKNVRLSDKEIKKLEGMKNLINASKADAIVRALPAVSVDSSYRLAEKRLETRSESYNGEKNEYYVWNLTYAGPVTKGDYSPEGAYAVVDAQSGEILSYSAHSWLETQSDEPATLVTDEKASELANAFFLAASADKFKNSKPYTDEDTVTIYSDDNVARFDYARYYDGIRVDSNGANISLDKASGKVTSYYSSWDKNVEFAKKDGIIDVEAAKQAYYESCKTSLGYQIITTYLYDKEENTEKETAMTAAVSMPMSSKMIYVPDVVERNYRAVLAYEISAAARLISATDAKPLNYNGEPIDEAAAPDFAGYTDIAGIRAERVVTLLCDIGVLARETEFKPNQVVTQGEFLECLAAAMYGAPISYQYAGNARVSVYRRIDNSDIIKDSEIDEHAEINRYDAAKFMVRALGYAKLSESVGLFKVSYTDSKSVPKVCAGSVALSKYFDLFPYISSVFDGARKLTRVEMAQSIYNFMAISRDR